MAGSRVHKCGNIFKRTRGLILSGALSHKERPLWYDVYERFPPDVSPDYDRPVPDQTVRQILYPEDMVRGYYEKNLKHLYRDEVCDMKDHTTKTICQRYVEECLKLSKEGLPNSEITKLAAANIKAEVEKERPKQIRTEMSKAETKKSLTSLRTQIHQEKLQKKSRNTGIRDLKVKMKQTETEKIPQGSLNYDEAVTKSLSWLSTFIDKKPEKTPSDSAEGVAKDQPTNEDRAKDLSTNEDRAKDLSANEERAQDLTAKEGVAKDLAANENTEKSDTIKDTSEPQETSSEKNTKD